MQSLLPIDDDIPLGPMQNKNALLLGLLVVFMLLWLLIISQLDDMLSLFEIIMRVRTNTAGDPFSYRISIKVRDLTDSCMWVNLAPTILMWVNLAPIV